MFNKDTKYLGEFKEERDGLVVIVQKWELVISAEEHNAKLDVITERATAKKVDERTPLGKIESIVIK